MKTHILPQYQEVEILEKNKYLEPKFICELGFLF